MHFISGCRLVTSQTACQRVRRPGCSHGRKLMSRRAEFRAVRNIDVQIYRGVVSDGKTARSVNIDNLF